MPKVYYDKKDEPAFELQLSPDLIAVRTRSGRSLQRSSAPVQNQISEAVADGDLVAAYPEAGVEVFRVPVERGAKALETRKTILRGSSDVRFAGGVLIDPQGNEPVLYTENLFIKFNDAADPKQCRDVLAKAGLTIKETIAYASNAFFVEAEEGIGRKVFGLAEELLKREDVQYCHPELIRPRARKTVFPQQWHLKETVVNGTQVDAHANVTKAHEITLGEGVTVAVIDDGFDIDHVEFGGEGKVVAPWDATMKIDDPRPKDWHPSYPDDHGTACAGVAVANGEDGASGVAPKAALMPIRLSSNLGSFEEASAFFWAVENGADVISCSWGPPDGRWWNAEDPDHYREVPLPPITRLAIDYATTQGRSGKGCVVLFAAGNGSELVENDGYASYEKVIAVAACNDTNRRSVYSDYGKAIWCCFPSGDSGHLPCMHPEPLTPGIWTTDRSGFKGYNDTRNDDGDSEGDYTKSFSGTSSACPGAAGVVALVLSVNPELTSEEVKDLLRCSCDQIDKENGEYGSDGHSIWYGYGRVNALQAVELAKKMKGSPTS